MTERLFRVLLLLAVIGPIAIAYDAISDVPYSITLLIWNLLPVAAAFVMFKKGYSSQAFGWLLAVTSFITYIWASIAFASDNTSTAAITFLWIPLWNMIVVGPIGASAGWAVKRLLSSTRPNRS
jgi:hypothetical protein